MSTLGPLRWELAESNGLPSLRFFGEIDMSTAEELGFALAEVEADTRDLLLDLRGVTFMDSTGISAIVGVHQQFNREGRRLLVAPSEPVQRVFEVTGLLEKLNILR
ncbi:MAG TPA: STAS domain-containing protein [Actinomycetota bacterium]|nr:STAS domain-containing protein [Actinomycetota bacterium]